MQSEKFIRFQHVLNSYFITFEKAEDILIRLEEHCFRNINDLNSFLNHFIQVIGKLAILSISVEKFNEVINNKSETIRGHNDLIKNNTRILQNQRGLIKEVSNIKQLLPLHAAYLVVIDALYRKGKENIALKSENDQLRKQIASLIGEKDNNSKGMQSRHNPLNF